MKNSLYPNRNIIAIDLKSFFASCECIERGLDPFTTALVVCDPTRNGAYRRLYFREDDRYSFPRTT